MGNCVEKLCGAEGAEGTSGAAKGKYSKIPGGEVDALVKQTNKDNEDFFKENIWWQKIEPCLIVPEKFIYLYPCYAEDQAALEALWKRIDLEKLMKKDFKRTKNEVLLYQWKYIIRKGVPFSKLRIVILEMFKKTFHDNELEYESAVKVCFQDAVPASFKNVSTFADEDRLEDVLKIHFLNEEGLYTIKKILWVFRKSFAKLDYSPMLPQVLALLLVFLSEAETFTVTKLLLEESVRLLDETQQYMAEEMKGLRWHLTLNREDFEKFITTFYNYVKKRSKAFVAIEKHLTRIGYDYMSLFNNWFKNLFFGFLPLPLIIKIFTTYLNEGIKIYYRMGYALLRTFKREVLAHTDPNTLTEMLRDKANNITASQIKKMWKKAYSLPLSSIQQKFSKLQVEVDETETNIFYLPYVASNSNIINNENFETLWEWLPKEHKLADPILAYSSGKDGWSIKTLYSKTEQFQGGYCMYVLIKTQQGAVFGAFLDQVFKPDWTGSKYVGSNESFVFQLYPKEIKYPASGKNLQHLVCAADYISIGNGGDGPAIYLDGELLNGHTYKCETYNNEQLNGKTTKAEASFTCIYFEVYVVD